MFDVLNAADLVLRPDFSEDTFEWCSDFIAILVWFASMFEEDFVFRGHADARWNLQPNICRISFETPPTTFEELIKVERRFVEEVRRARWLTLRDGFTPSEYLDFIGVLQHKGIATRLIDVTADPLVATFFAALDDTRDGAVLSILRQSSDLAKTSVSTGDPVQFAVESALYSIWSPPPIEPRMVAQRGEFLLLNGRRKVILADPVVMTELKPRGKANYKIQRIAYEYFRSETKGRPVEHPPNMAMFYLPKEYKPEMRSVLRSLGVSERSLFPDLEGFAAIFRS